MTQILAHLALLGRHDTTVLVGGHYFTYCTHRSHTLGLKCWRWMIWDGRCSVHASSCFDACPDDAFAVDIYDTETETEF